MTIHTEIPKVQRKVPTNEDRITSFSAIPELTDVQEILPMCSRLLGEHGDKEQIMMAIGAFVGQFVTWQDLLLGGVADAEGMENILMNESIVLDLTNDWFRRSKPMLEPVLMECKSCLTMVRILKAIGDEDKGRLDEEIDLVWFQFVRMWDFIPWFVFMGSGSVAVYTSIKMLMSRYCVVAKPEFVKRYREMRNASS